MAGRNNRRHLTRNESARRRAEKQVREHSGQSKFRQTIASLRAHLDSVERSISKNNERLDDFASEISGIKMLQKNVTKGLIEEIAQERREREDASKFILQEIAGIHVEQQNFKKLTTINLRALIEADRRILETIEILNRKGNPVAVRTNRSASTISVPFRAVPVTSRYFRCECCGEKFKGQIQLNVHRRKCFLHI